MLFIIKVSIPFIIVLFLASCVPPPRGDSNFTANRDGKPLSILVLPPLNASPDIRATYSFLSTVTKPLAESGYYVFPVALVDQTFKENGMSNPGEMHQAPLNKIMEVFGADATLYITVTEYGTQFKVFRSDITVSAEAELVDNRTGELLWQGKASVVDSSGKKHRTRGMANQFILAVVDQLINNIGDPGHELAEKTSVRLLNGPKGLPYGPRSPDHKAD